MSEEILRGADFEKKIELNKKFIVRLTHLLERPGSFDYEFKALETVSMLSPEDESFRIFTWYMADRDPEAYYADFSHYYFGLIQRNYTTAAGKKMLIVIPLMEMDRVPQGIENMVTDNRNWYGALYYKPKHSDHLLSYEGSYYKLVPVEDGKVVENKDKEWVYTFTPGKYRSRTLKQVDKLSYSNHKRVKEKVTYYTLMGWNGWDNKANYKVLDILTFDPDDSTRAVFGAPIMYFGKIPKARALFKYSDYSAFSMNTSFIRTGPFNMFKRKMIVYDHLAAPNKSSKVELWQVGPDGSYDAVSYFKKYGGYFEWYRNVEVAENYEGRNHRKKMLKLQKEWMSKDSLRYTVDPALIQNYSKTIKTKDGRDSVIVMDRQQMKVALRNEKRQAKMTQKELEKQRKEAEQKLKDQGIEMESRREDDEDE